MTRQEAIYELSNAFKYNVDDPFIVACDMAIEALQAGKPRGEWVEEQKRNFLDTRLNVGIKKKEITGKGYHTYLNVRCTNCNKVTMVDETIIYSYCPHCGARMDGERSEE